MRSAVQTQPEWLKVTEEIEARGLIVGIMTDSQMEGRAMIRDRLIVETTPGESISPTIFSQLEALRRQFDENEAVRAEMLTYYWSIGGVVRSA